MGWLGCVLNFSLICAAIQCIWGARSANHRLCRYHLNWFSPAEEGRIPSCYIRNPYIRAWLLTQASVQCYTLITPYFNVNIVHDKQRKKLENHLLRNYLTALSNAQRNSYNTSRAAHICGNTIFILLPCCADNLSCHMFVKRFLCLSITVWIVLCMQHPGWVNRMSFSHTETHLLQEANTGRVSKECDMSPSWPPKDESTMSMSS